MPDLKDDFYCRIRHTLEATRVWVVDSTISKRILTDFKADPSEEWGKGVYFLGVGEHTALVAVHQLKPTRDTLWLRILGKGKIQKP